MPCGERAGSTQVAPSKSTRRVASLPGVSLCLIFVDAPPGRGPSLHKHDYDEVFTTLEDEATVIVAEEERVVGPGDTAILPAGASR